VLPREIAALAANNDFSGVVRVDADGAHEIEWSAAFGPASRRFGVHNRVDTTFAIASGCRPASMPR
jgi:hypothetical protein